MVLLSVPNRAELIVGLIEKSSENSKSASILILGNFGADKISWCFKLFLLFVMFS